MESLEQNREELRSMIRRQEKRVRYYETTSINQITFYLVFQTIVFFTISRPFRCENWWVPFSLSLIGALVFFVAHVATVVTYLRAQVQYDSNIIRLEMMRSNNMGSGTNVVVCDRFRMYKQRVKALSVAFLLVVFTCVVLLACRSVPCAY